MLRLPLAVLVVFIHSYFDYPIADAGGTGQAVYEGLRSLFSLVVSHTAVPTFFLISGYYFFRNCEGFGQRDYESKIAKKARTLLIPYLVWNLLGMLQMIAARTAKSDFSDLADLRALFEEFGAMPFNVLWDYHSWDSCFSWTGQHTVGTGPVLLPLWFLRDLMVMTALTPLIFYLIRKKKNVFMAALFAGYLSGFTLFHIPSVGSLFFFSLGACMGIGKETIVGRFRKHRVAAYVLTGLMIVPMVVFDGSRSRIGSLLYPVFICAGVMSLMNVAFELSAKKGSYIRRKRTMRPAMSFFIYLAHPFFLRSCRRAVILALPHGGWCGAALCYMACPLLCVAVCVAAFMLLRKLAPSLLELLTGSRV